MKIFFTVCFFLIGITKIFCQDSSTSDAGRISLAPLVSDNIKAFPPSAKDMLHNKLLQIVTKFGSASTNKNSRFILTANVSILSKDITPSAPPMHAYSLEVTLYIGDGIDGVLFSSKSFTIKGVGETEEKAYKAALKAIKSADPSYESFFQDGKQKIIAYYTQKCDFLLKEAEMLAAKNSYQDALLLLTDIPQVCKDCYDQAMKDIVEGA